MGGRRPAGSMPSSRTPAAWRPSPRTGADAVAVRLSGAGLADLVARWGARDGTSFAIGVTGALAEFHAMPGEATRWTRGAEGVAARCSGGSFRLLPQDGALALAFDLPGRHARQRGALFCLPAAVAALAGAGVLHRAGRRDGAALFDLGLGQPAVEALVAVADDALAARLRAAEGERLVGGGHPLLAALAAASPPRLFRSALAEIVVTQAIPRDATPAGPHTHLLPAAMDGSRHDPRIVLPAGWLPCLAMHAAAGDPAFPALARRLGAEGWRR